LFSRQTLTQDSELTKMKTAVICMVLLAISLTYTTACYTYDKSRTRGKEIPCNFWCKWVGTAPFCAGDSDDCEGTTTPHAMRWSSTIPSHDEWNFGEKCWTGEKVLCCNYHTHGYGQFSYSTE